ncbi:MAG TPA: aspartyl protease family protein [Verrucomicrobiae bacterium]|nr:aspartyl protease family protein [Verrucomicrobiae bacterium]
MRGLARLSLCSLVVLAASSANAAVPSARAVIERYVQVSGGRAALDADTVLHVTGHSIDAGMKGTFEVWMQAPSRALRIDRVGTLRTKQGIDGTVAWRTDYTSKRANPVEGKDLEAMLADIWFATEQWARDTTSKALLGQSSFIAGRSLQGVDITPPVGPKQTLWFDQKTGLLARVTHHRDQHEWNEELSVWKTLAGRKRATVSEVGMVQFPSSYHREQVDSLWAKGAKDPMAFAVPGSTAAPVVWTGARAKIELPFRYSRGHVWVKLSLNGAPPAEFVLDTGAFNTCLDRGIAQTLGLQPEGEYGAQGVGGYDTFGFAPLKSVRWSNDKGASVEIRDLRVGVIGLQEMTSSVEWGRTNGLLGYDVLSRFTLDIDFDREVITLWDPATYVHQGPGTPIPMTLNGNIPTVEMTINGNCKGTYIVDVGNASVLSVGAEQVMKCRLLALQHKEVQHWVGGIGGAFQENVTRLDSLRLGPFLFTEPVAGLTTHHQGSAGSLEVQGNIGTTVLERFRCTFDYAHGQLWLAPGARFAEREAFTRSGLWYTRWAGVVVVFGVVRGSPAEDAGLKIRDVLRSINGKSVEKMTPEELDRVLRDGKAGSTIKLTYERELKEETVEMTLADVL